MDQRRKRRQGKTLVYTGDGKGKTTAAMGLALRALGHDFSVRILQFIKSPHRAFGEMKILQQHGVEVTQLGVGFTWTRTPEEHREALRNGWLQAKEAVLSGQYDLVVLDELNIALAIKEFPIDDVLPLEEVKHMIKNKPSHVYLVITGRSALEEINELADLVSVVNVEKHYFDKGVKAVRGIEY